MGVDGIVFDVSVSESGREFYGPTGGYHCFAGRDATFGLATMNLTPAEWEGKTAADVSPSQREVLDNWIARYREK